MDAKICKKGERRIAGQCMSKSKEKAFTTELVKENWYRIEEPYLVNTPKPYVIDVSDYTKSEKIKFKKRLNANTKTLKSVIKALGISEGQAINKEYTLNYRTWESLYRIALNRRKYDVADKIKNMAW